MGIQPINGKTGRWQIAQYTQAVAGGSYKNETKGHPMYPYNEAYLHESRYSLNGDAFLYYLGT